VTVLLTWLSFGFAGLREINKNPTARLAVGFVKFVRKNQNPTAAQLSSSAPDNSSRARFIFTTPTYINRWRTVNAEFGRADSAERSTGAGEGPMGI